jgi:hypothetical protein
MKKINFKTWLVPIGLALVLVAFRLPGVNQPYHQDEFKWAQIVAKGSPVAGIIPHPPLSEAIYIFADRVFGNDHLRIMPLLFSILNLFLLYAVVKRRYGPRVAVVASAVYAVAFHSVLASLMVDTDGQVLPFWFLLAVMGYDRWRDAATKKRRLVWLALFFGGLIGGLLTKLSCILPVAAFGIDALIEYRHHLTRKRLFKIGIAFLIGFGVILIALLNAHFVFKTFSLDWLFAYTSRFFTFGSRNHFQIMVQVLKSVMYASPLLLAPVLLVSKDMVRRTRLFWIFMGVALMFYLVLFDFSVGCLDRYLQVLVVPLSVISSLVYVEIFEKHGKRIRIWHAATAAIAAIALFGLQFLPHIVPPQHPKAEWLARIISFKWNFLFPFSGGSGPLGFYVSFLLMAVGFLVALALVVAIRVKPQARKILLLILAAVGFAYNLAFTEEYLFGAINGNAPDVMRKATTFVIENPEIETVITYNDIAANELTNAGKYYKRLYVDPMFEASNIKKLNEAKGYYLVVDMPHLNPDSIYAKYFASCRAVYHDSSGRIDAYVYDCREAQDVE